MSSHQDKIDLEMRLAAIEFMVCKVWGALIGAGGRTIDLIDEGLDQLAGHAKTQLFPGLDAALSDHASDEYATAVRRLTEATKVLVRSTREP